MEVQRSSQQKTRSFSRGLVSGSVAAITSGLAIALFSKKDSRTAYSAQNAVSHWLWGEEATHRHDLSVRHTLVGYGIHHASAVFWGVIYEHLMRSKPLPPTAELLRATAFAGVANFVDYRLTPPRFKPGFERHLSRKSLALVYGAFAVGLAAGHLLQQGQRRDRPAASATRRT